MRCRAAPGKKSRDYADVMRCTGLRREFKVVESQRWPRMTDWGGLSVVAAKEDD